MKILIATSACPQSEESFKGVCKGLRDEAIDRQVEIVGGIIWCPGYGCCNVSFEVEGEESQIERFANAITLALMPAKWTTTGDDIPEIDTWIK